MPGAISRRFCWANRGTAAAVVEQLALTIAQQAAAGASGGLGAGLQLGGIQGICIAGQAAAPCGELVQHVVHTAALGADGAKAMV